MGPASWHCQRNFFRIGHGNPMLEMRPSEQCVWMLASSTFQPLCAALHIGSSRKLQQQPPSICCEPCIMAEPSYSLHKASWASLTSAVHA